MKRHIITLSALVAATSLSAHADNLTVNNHDAEATAVQTVETSNSDATEGEQRLSINPSTSTPTMVGYHWQVARALLFRARRATLCLNPTCLYKQVATSIGMMMKVLTRHTTKITLKIQALPSPMPYLVLRVRPLAKYRLTSRSMQLKVVATCCNKHGLM